MLKTTGRIIVILLAIGLVAGGLYWMAQNHPSIPGLGDNRLGLMEEGTRLDRGSRDLSDREEAMERGLPLNFPLGGMRLHDSEGRLDSGRAWASILRNILIIAAITLLVVGVQKLYTWLFRRRKAQMA